MRTYLKMIVINTSGVIIYYPFPFSWNVLGCHLSDLKWGGWKVFVGIFKVQISFRLRLQIFSKPYQSSNSNIVGYSSVIWMNSFLEEKGSHLFFQCLFFFCVILMKNCFIKHLILCLIFKSCYNIKINKIVIETIATK